MTRHDPAEGGADTQVGTCTQDTEHLRRQADASSALAAMEVIA